MVWVGFVIAWRLAIWPTSRSPSSVKATIEGVVRAPSRFGITCGDPTSMTAAHEFVVPRSIPSTFAKLLLPIRRPDGHPRPDYEPEILFCPAETTRRDAGQPAVGPADTFTIEGRR